MLALQLAGPALRFLGLVLQLAGPALRFPGLAALTSSLLVWKQKTLPFGYLQLVSVHSRVVSRRYWLHVSRCALPITVHN